MHSTHAYCFLAAVALAFGAEPTRVLDPAGTAFDDFGRALASTGTRLVVGALSDDQRVLVFDADEASAISPLSPDVPAPGSRFGWSVATSPGAIAVGAPHDGERGTLAGAVYLYDAASGAQRAKLLLEDGPPMGRFGASVAIDEGYVLACTQRFVDDEAFTIGEAYLFDAETGAFVRTLDVGAGDTGDSFGVAVALDGSVAAIGAVALNGQGYFAGGVYLFDVETGGETALLEPDSGAAMSLFGASVALTDSAIVVGAPGDADGTGAVYVFDRATLNRRHKLVAEGSPGGAGFGDAVAAFGSLLAVGAPRDDEAGTRAGTAYVFDLETGAQLAKHAVGGAGDRVGQAVAMGGGLLAAGAPKDDSTASDAGAVWLLTPPMAPADFDQSGRVDSMDLAALLAAWGAPGETDLDGDGATGASDLQLLLAAWSGG